jgi:hypothetical protein
MLDFSKDVLLKKDVSTKGELWQVWDVTVTSVCAIYCWKLDCSNWLYC